MMTAFRGRDCSLRNGGVGGVRQALELKREEMNVEKSLNTVEEEKMDGENGLVMDGGSSEDSEITVLDAHVGAREASKAACCACLVQATCHAHSADAQGSQTT